MAKLQDELIKIITNQVEKLPSRSKIVSVLLGGSYASGTFSETSDIDLLVISKKASQERIYSDIKDSFRNLSLRHKLDIKIIGMEQIHTLSNSTSAPFFYHFSQHSKLLYGEDLRSNFSLSKTWMYQTLQSAFDNLKTIKAIVYDYYDIKKGKVLLFELSKKIMTISLKIHEKEQDLTQAVLSFFSVFNEQTKEDITKLTTRNKSWISIHKQEEDQMGFNLLKIRSKKQRPTEEQIQLVDEWIEDLQALLNFTLDDLAY